MKLPAGDATMLLKPVFSARPANPGMWLVIREIGPPSCMPATAPVPAPMRAALDLSQSQSVRVPIWICWYWAMASMKNSSPISSMSSRPSGEASSRTIRLRPVAPLSAASLATWVDPAPRPATAASRARMRPIAARPACAYGPMSGAVEPAVKNATYMAMAMATADTQNATLTESLEYCVSTAKSLTCDE